MPVDVRREKPSRRAHHGGDTRRNKAVYGIRYLGDAVCRLTQGPKNNSPGLEPIRKSCHPMSTGRQFGQGLSGYTRRRKYGTSTSVVRSCLKTSVGLHQGSSSPRMERFHRARRAWSDAFLHTRNRTQSFGITFNKKGISATGSPHWRTTPNGWAKSCGGHWAIENSLHWVLS